MGAPGGEEPGTFGRFTRRAEEIYGARFAGTYSDGRGGFVVAITAGDIRPIPGFPDARHVVVTYSYEELVAARDVVLRDHWLRDGDSAGVVEAGPNVRRNRVDLLVHGMTLDEARARFTPPYRVKGISPTRHAGVAMPAQPESGPDVRL